MFTFKKHEKVGRYRSFQADNWDIKIKRKCVGSISQIRDTSAFPAAPGTAGKLRIGFMVKKEVTKEEPAPFRWIRLKYLSDSIDEAKTFLQSHYDEILQKFDLYHMED